MNEELYKQFINEYFDFVSKSCKKILRGFYSFLLDDHPIFHVTHRVFGKVKNSEKMYKLLLEGNQVKIHKFLYVCVRNASIDYVKKDKKNKTFQGAEISNAHKNTCAESDDLEEQIGWKNAMDVFKNKLPQSERKFVDLLLAGFGRKDIAHMPGWDGNRYDYELKKLKKMKNKKGFKWMVELLN